MFVIQ